MRQGRASRDVSEGGKREPRSHAMNPPGIAQYGIAKGDHVTDGGGTGYRGEPKHVGRGYSAPHDDGRKVHPSGSQGRR